MKRKRKNMAKRETAKTNNDKSYYKNFVIPCVIFFVGYYFSVQLFIHGWIFIVCELGNVFQIKAYRYG